MATTPSVLQLFVVGSAREMKKEKKINEHDQSTFCVVLQTEQGSMAVCLRDETGTGKIETKTQRSTDPRSAGGSLRVRAKYSATPILH